MKKFLFAVTASLLIIGLAHAAFDDDLKKLAEENGKNYIQPFATAFGTNMNSGLFHTARPHRLLGFDIKVSFMGAMIPDEALTYTFAIPDSIPFDTLMISTENFYGYKDFVAPTVFGSNELTEIPPDEAALLNSLEDAFGYQPADSIVDQAKNAATLILPPGVDFSIFPLAMPQVSVGLPLKSEIMLRFYPKSKINDDIGEFGFFGIGLKHSISQYIPLCPVKIAAQFVYQRLEVGDIIKSTHTNLNLQVSKSLILITPYAGIGIETSDMEIEYTIESPGSYLDGQTVKFDIEGENSMHFRAGLNINLIPFLGFNAEYAFGKYNVFTLGAYFSFR